MVSVEYGGWNILVDIDKTKEYYSQCAKSESADARNFALCCDTLSEEEYEFFESLGIDPKCGNASCICGHRGGFCFYFGYYPVAGKYCKIPEKSLIVDDEEFGFSDDADFYTLNFQFTFDGYDGSSNIKPQNVPDGFIYISFYSESFDWILDEDPESLGL